MKTIIAGSRGITDYDVLLKAVQESGFLITTVISGCARGADKLGERYAAENGLPVILCPADWDKHGKQAGYVRNAEMSRQGQALIALWDGFSPGTKMMIQLAKERMLKVYVKIT